MATLKSLTIANASDAVICEAVANQAVSAESGGLRSILISAVYFRVRGDNDLTKITLQKALLDAGMASGSASNYLSKARAAADDKHFSWSVDVNAEFDDVVDAIMPEFSAYWGGVNAITRSGPPTDAKKGAAKAKREDNAKKKQEIAQQEAREKAAMTDQVASLQAQAARAATPQEVMASFLSMVSQVIEDREGRQRPALDATDLMAVARAIEEELLQRQATGAVSPRVIEREMALTA